MYKSVLIQLPPVILLSVTCRETIAFGLHHTSTNFTCRLECRGDSSVCIKPINRKHKPMLPIYMTVAEPTITSSQMSMRFKWGGRSFYICLRYCAKWGTSRVTRGRFQTYILYCEVYLCYWWKQRTNPFSFWVTYPEHFTRLRKHLRNSSSVVCFPTGILLLHVLVNCWPQKISWLIAVRSLLSRYCILSLGCMRLCGTSSAPFSA